MNKVLPKFCFFALLMLLTFVLNAQNLVPNHSFENYSTCPTTLGQIYLATGWSTTNAGSSDYYNSCDTGIVSVPGNFVGVQDALTGVGYAGIVVHFIPNPNYREYIQATLTEPLVAGFCYELEMFTSSAEGWPMNGISNVGIYLSVSPPVVDANDQIIVTPQLFYDYTILDTDNWVQLTGTYTAAGGEQYITIGNFFENGSYNIEPLDPPNNTGDDAAYYYIEDVRVELRGQEGEDDIEVSICEGDSIEFEGEFFSESGLYSAVYEGIDGCDSILNLDLTVYEEYDILIEATICEGMSYEFGDSVYTESGVYENMFLTVQGCDSIISLNLNVDLNCEICPPFPAATGCAYAVPNCEGIDGYCNTLIPQTDLTEAMPGCGGTAVLNNDDWISFFASTETITIHITPSNCQNIGGSIGIQAGIYATCDDAGGVNEDGLASEPLAYSMPMHYGSYNFEFIKLYHWSSLLFGYRRLRSGYLRL